MATPAQSLPEHQPPLRWFWEFLKDELAPYPGRAALVARMLVAATLSMLISMIFRIPDGAFGAIFALQLSRESPYSTITDARNVAIAFALSATYELVGAWLFLDNPTLRLVWAMVTLVLVFYTLRVLRHYTAGIRFGYLAVITIPIWDQHVPAEAKVEGTLWAVWVITLSTIITTIVELIYAEWNKGSDLVLPITERLTYIEQLLASYAAGRPVEDTTKKNILRLTTVGMSRLRRNLQRANCSSHYREQMGALIALIARMMDVSASLADLELKPSEDDRERMQRLAGQIAAIRSDLDAGRAPRPPQSIQQDDTPSAVPLLRELETTAALISQVFADSRSLSQYAPPTSPGEPPNPLFRADALRNPEYIRFALKGALAAFLCYIVYNLVDWPGISTSIVTCFLTAQTTIGSSRQRQILRFAGAIVGGVLLGFGSQIFILPHLDSIAGFTLLFLAVTFIAAWFATASARISYFGIQIAVAFYLINLQEFKIQTSLTVARDRVFGILLGLSVMWLVFDQLWGAPAVVEMRRTFIANLRLMAQLSREPQSQDIRAEVERMFVLRETVNTSFDSVRAAADAVLLEFGPSRAQDLVWRDRIRNWQTQMRMLFITRVTLWKYRLGLPGFELPPSVAAAQAEFDSQLASTLEALANRLENKPAADDPSTLATAFERLQDTARNAAYSESLKPLPAGFESVVELSRRTEQLAISLAEEITASGDTA